MPFGALERQALGLSILKACLTRASIDCEIRYLNFDFAGLVGVHDYFWAAHELPYTAFAGDWCFTAQLYDTAPCQDDYVGRILRDEWLLPETDIKRLLRVRSLTPVFLEHCLSSVDWSRYQVVGFTSTFEQNVASLALARQIKQLHPAIRIVFGGANWELHPAEDAALRGSRRRLPEGRDIGGDRTQPAGGAPRRSAYARL